MSVFYFTLFFSFPSELIFAHITDRNGTKNTEIIEGNEDHNMKTREYDFNGADSGYSRRRRRGMPLAPEEVCKLGIESLTFHIGFHVVRTVRLRSSDYQIFSDG